MGKSFFRCRGARRSQSADRKCRGAHVGRPLLPSGEKIFIFRTGSPRASPYERQMCPATGDWPIKTYVCNRAGLML